MSDHKSVVEAVKKATSSKVSFSKSPRKGNKEFLAIKLEATPERVEALEQLLAEPVAEGWALFFSKDKSTTGLYVIADTAI